MTAEIVLLNREAVVLAADSAATIEGRAGTKIYHAENKLFTLSKYRPVGVMIYNAVQLCGVPWETIIKEYRKQLNDSSFNTLSEYADDFIKYLNNNTYLFPIDQQAEAVTQTITRRFREIREKYHESLRNHPGQNKPAAFDAVLQSTLAALERRPLLTGFDATFEDRVSRDFRSSSRILAEAVFARKRFPRNVFAKIERIAVLSFTRELRLAEATGLVITGFGEKEIFPRLRCFNMDGIIFGRLKMTEGQNEIISIDNPATWRSFAQSEVASAIIGGVHPAYKANFLTGALRLVHDNVIAALNAIAELTVAQRQGYIQKLTNNAIDAWRKYFSDMDAYARTTFEEPVRQSLDGLGKDDLAKIAESLVSITSFRQQISPEEETVGGPIDVAVISKGDGFIWIKRKYYFDEKFNPYFMERYYRDT